MNIDLGAFAQAIANAIVQSVQHLLSPVPVAFMTWVSGNVATLWDAFWTSGANLLATPLDLTENYMPAIELGGSMVVIVPAITVLAAALLGLRHMWQSMSGGGKATVQDDLFHGILLAILLSGTSLMVLHQAFELTWLASNTFGHFDFAPDFNPKSLLDIEETFLITAVTVIAMLFYGWKLMVRAAYRIVLLMFMTPFAPIASIMWAIPQTRWIAQAYWVTIGGWLAGGVLAMAAVSLGAQIALHEFGILGLFFGIALLQLAHDVMIWLPQWTGYGRINFPTANLNWLALFTAGGAAAAAAGGAAAGGAASAAAGGALATIGSANTSLVPVGAGYD